MHKSAYRGYLRREKLDVGTGRHVGSVYVPVRSSLEDLVDALHQPHVEPYDLCVDARLLATYITRPKLLGPAPVLDRLTGFVLDVDSLTALPARVLTELGEARIILDLPTAHLPWGLLSDLPGIEEIRLGPEFASRSSRLGTLSALQAALSGFVQQISLSAPSREWAADEMLTHIQAAGIHTIECPVLSTSDPDAPNRPKVVRGPFDITHGAPYRPA